MQSNSNSHATYGVIQNLPSQSKIEIKSSWPENSKPFVEVTQINLLQYKMSLNNLRK